MIRLDLGIHLMFQLEGGIMAVKVFVFDPGLTTGVVMARVSLEATESVLISQIRDSMKLYHVKFPNEAFGTMKLWKMIRDFMPDRLLGEDFVLFPDQKHFSDRAGLAPDRILAMIDLLVHLNTTEGLRHNSGFLPQTCEKQMPGDRMIITDAWLREKELWRTPKQIDGAVTGDKNHAMDALRHLIVFCRKARSRR